MFAPVLTLDFIPISPRGLLGFILAVGIIDAPEKLVREILLRRPVIWKVVRIKVSLFPLKTIAVGMDVLQMARDGACAPHADIGQRGQNCVVAGVGLGSRGQ